MEVSSAAGKLDERLDEAVRSAGAMYQRLVLLAGPRRSGKTAALERLAARHDTERLNVGLVVSEELLDFTDRQRVLKLPRVLDCIADEQGDPVLMDNIELLFEPSLECDPLRLLGNLSRNRTVVAAWRGSCERGVLSYAQPGHPEYRRHKDVDALVVTTGEGSSDS